MFVAASSTEMSVPLAGSPDTSASDFYTTLQQPLPLHKGFVELSAIAIRKKNDYQIIDGQNEMQFRLGEEEQADLHCVRLPPGIYSGAEMADVIQSALNSATPMLEYANWTCTYSTISNPPGFSIRWSQHTPPSANNVNSATGPLNHIITQPGLTTKGFMDWDAAGIAQPVLGISAQGPDLDRFTEHSPDDISPNVMHSDTPLYLGEPSLGPTAAWRGHNVIVKPVPMYEKCVLDDTDDNPVHSGLEIHETARFLLYGDLGSRFISGSHFGCWFTFQNNGNPQGHPMNMDYTLHVPMDPSSRRTDASDPMTFQAELVTFPCSIDLAGVLSIQLLNGSIYKLAWDRNYVNDMGFYSPPQALEFAGQFITKDESDLANNQTAYIRCISGNIIGTAAPGSTAAAPGSALRCTTEPQEPTVGGNNSVLYKLWSCGYFNSHCNAGDDYSFCPNSLQQPYARARYMVTQVTPTGSDPTVGKIASFVIVDPPIGANDSWVGAGGGGYRFSSGAANSDEEKQTQLYFDDGDTLVNPNPNWTNVHANGPKVRLYETLAGATWQSLSLAFNQAGGGYDYFNVQALNRYPTTAIALSRYDFLDPRRALIDNPSHCLGDIELQLISKLPHSASHSGEGLGIILKQLRQDVLDYRGMNRPISDVIGQEVTPEDWDTNFNDTNPMSAWVSWDSDVDNVLIGIQQFDMYNSRVYIAHDTAGNGVFVDDETIGVTGDEFYGGRKLELTLKERMWPLVPTMALNPGSLLGGGENQIFMRGSYFLFNDWQRYDRTNGRHPGQLPYGPLISDDTEQFDTEYPTTYGLLPRVCLKFKELNASQIDNTPATANEIAQNDFNPNTADSGEVLGYESCFFVEGGAAANMRRWSSRNAPPSMAKHNSFIVELPGFPLRGWIGKSYDLNGIRRGTGVRSQILHVVPTNVKLDQITEYTDWDYVPAFSQAVRYEFESLTELYELQVRLRDTVTGKLLELCHPTQISFRVIPDDLKLL